jgi:hypothetical protein
MKTALMLSGEIVGIVEDLLETGDVIQVQTNGNKMSHPMIVRQIISIPKFEEKNIKQPEADQIAYLHYDEKLVQKFTQKKKSQKLEKSLARNLGGRTTPGSGAFSFHKGDVNSDIWLAEHKYTDKSKYRLSLKIWEKIKEEAQSYNKLPLMEVVINGESNPLKLIIVSLQDFQSSTNSTEEEFLLLFFCGLIESKTAGVNLLKKDIEMQFETIRYNFEGKLPALLLKIKDTQLFALTTEDFVRIFSE